MLTTHQLFRRTAAACLALGAAVALTPALVAQTAVDPDPEIFDGTRTKKDEIPQDSSKKKVDKWEDANLILYDSEEQGSAEGGQGRAGGDTPGYADGGVQINVGAQAGLPMPMAGMGGAGTPGAVPPIPMNGGAGMPSAQQPIPGMVPTSEQSTPTPAGAAGQGQPEGKPGEVSIGDNSQRIATSAQPVNKIQGGVPPPPTGEPVEKSKGEDTTTIPNAASGQQSNQRGGGVEKGDAMPTDI